MGVKGYPEDESIVISPDGQYFAFANALDGNVRVWNIDQNAEVAQFNHPALANSEEYQVLYSDYLEEFNLNNLPPEEFLIPAGRVHTFSPDNRYLLTSILDTAVVWDIVTNQLVARIPFERNWIHAMMMSPNGRYVAIAGEFDDEVRIWDLSANREVTRLQGYAFPGEKNQVSFSEDSRLLIINDLDSAIAESFLLDHTDLIHVACQHLYRNLTVQEWRQFVGNEPYRKTCENLPSPDDIDLITPDTPSAILNSAIQIQRFFSSLFSRHPS